MTVNKYLMPIIAIAALIAVVLGARLTGDWIVSGKQIPLGDMTAADIKGWMTLQNVSDGLQIPLPDLYKLAGIPEGAAVPPTTAMKDLEGLVGGVRGFAAARSGRRLPGRWGRASPGAGVRTRAADRYAGPDATPSSRSDRYTCANPARSSRSDRDAAHAAEYRGGHGRRPDPVAARPGAAV